MKPRKQKPVTTPTGSKRGELNKPKPSTSQCQALRQHNTENTSADELSLWEHSVACHRRMAEWLRFQRQEGISEGDLMDFAMYGEFAAQTYLLALREAVRLPGSRRSRESYFERLLLEHVRRLNEILCALAQEGRRGACNEVWDQALRLSETFSELALKNPSPFKHRARQSLFMPSIRARNPDFSADGEAIAQAIELSTETIGDKLTDNRVRLGALCARLVAECVHEIKRARALWAGLFTPYKRAVVWPTLDQVKPFQGKSIDDLFRGASERLVNVSAEHDLESHLRLFCLSADCGPERLHFLTLPELAREKAPEWWKGAVEKMIEERFPRLLENPAWAERLKAASTGTRADMLKELKDYTRDKVKQFA